MTHPSDLPSWRPCFSSKGQNPRAAAFTGGKKTDWVEGSRDGRHGERKGVDAPELAPRSLPLSQLDGVVDQAKAGDDSSSYKNARPQGIPSAHAMYAPQSDHPNTSTSSTFDTTSPVKPSTRVAGIARKTSSVNKSFSNRRTGLAKTTPPSTAQSAFNARAPEYPGHNGPEPSTPTSTRSSRGPLAKPWVSPTVVSLKELDQQKRNPEHKDVSSSDHPEETIRKQSNAIQVGKKNCAACNYKPDHVMSPCSHKHVSKINKLQPQSQKTTSHLTPIGMPLRPKQDKQTAILEQSPNQYQVQSSDTALSVPNPRAAPTTPSTTTLGTQYRGEEQLASNFSTLSMDPRNAAMARSSESQGLSSGSVEGGRPLPFTDFETSSNGIFSHSRDQGKFDTHFSMRIFSIHADSSRNSNAMHGKDGSYQVDASQSQGHGGNHIMSQAFHSIPNVPAWEFAPPRHDWQQHEFLSIQPKPMPWTQGPNFGQTTTSPYPQQGGIQSHPARQDSVHAYGSKPAYQQATHKERVDQPADLAQGLDGHPHHSTIQQPEQFGASELNSSYGPQAAAQNSYTAPVAHIGNLNPASSSSDHSSGPVIRRYHDSHISLSKMTSTQHKAIVDGLNQHLSSGKDNGSPQQKNTTNDVHGQISGAHNTGTGVPTNTERLTHAGTSVAPEPAEDHRTPSKISAEPTETAHASSLDLQAIPFITLGSSCQPMNWGVVKISNIPYAATRNEVLAFLGRNARVIGFSDRGAVHILMDRNTGKTLECFVEFVSHGDAMIALTRFERARDAGRHPRIGNRHANVELSSQEELMASLFPRAKCVDWEGQHPRVYETTEPFNSGFKTFITSEELVMTVRHAETPARSPFATKCPQRVFESMISTLMKFPWWATPYISLSTRDQLARASESLVRVLVNKVDRDDLNLNQQLLDELLRTSLSAPGFSEAQKCDILHSAGAHAHRYQLSPFAPCWNFLALGRKPELPDDVVEAYAAILRQAASDQTEVSQVANYAQSKMWFGDIQMPWPANKGDLSLLQASQIEWTRMVQLLSSAFAKGGGNATN
ncbi:MAG: Arp complex subunit [Chaenotheca gracillima]|nr:MAG: Arp complex subunit [Chaenotheca gracillima]